MNTMFAFFWIVLNISEGNKYEKGCKKIKGGGGSTLIWLQNPNIIIF
jgi:hypothetical protein